MHPYPVSKMITHWLDPKQKFQCSYGYVDNWTFLEKIQEGLKNKYSPGDPMADTMIIENQQNEICLVYR